MKNEKSRLGKKRKTRRLATDENLPGKMRPHLSPKVLEAIREVGERLIFYANEGLRLKAQEAREMNKALASKAPN